MLSHSCSGSKYCVNIEANDQNGNKVEFQEIVGFSNTGSYGEHTRAQDAIYDVKSRMPYLRNIRVTSSFRI